jgi:hypothetical protein
VNGTAAIVLFNERLTALDTRLDALRGQDQALARELAAGIPATLGSLRCEQSPISSANFVTKSVGWAFA